MIIQLFVVIVVSFITVFVMTGGIRKLKDSRLPLDEIERRWEDAKHLHESCTKYWDPFSKDLFSEDLSVRAIADAKFQDTNKKMVKAMRDEIYWEDIYKTQVRRGRKV